MYKLVKEQVDLEKKIENSKHELKILGLDKEKIDDFLNYLEPQLNKINNSIDELDDKKLYRAERKKIYREELDDLLDSKKRLEEEQANVKNYLHEIYTSLKMFRSRLCKDGIENADPEIQDSIRTILWVVHKKEIKLIGESMINNGKLGSLKYRIGEIEKKIKGGK